MNVTFRKKLRGESGKDCYHLVQDVLATYKPYRLTLNP